MALELYTPSVPSEVRLDDEPILGVYQISLYDADTDNPSGSMTADRPLDVGQTGRLTFVGTRENKQWEVTIENIEVTRASAVGFEFSISGQIERKVLRELEEKEQ